MGTVSRELLSNLAETTFDYINETEYLITNADLPELRTPSFSREHGCVNYHLKTTITREMQAQRLNALNEIRENASFDTYTPADIKYSAREAMRVKAGQCYETSCIVFYKICQLYPNYPLRVEIFNNPLADHNYVVVNRDPFSDPLEPTTWGDDCLVIDRWADEWFFIDEEEKFELSIMNLVFEEYVPAIDPLSTPTLAHNIPARVVRQSIDLSNYRTTQDLNAYFSSTCQQTNANIPFCIPLETDYEFAKLRRKAVYDKYKRRYPEKVSKKQKDGWYKSEHCNLYFKSKKLLVKAQMYSYQYRLPNLEQEAIEDLAGSQHQVRLRISPHLLRGIISSLSSTEPRAELDDAEESKNTQEMG